MLRLLRLPEKFSFFWPSIGSSWATPEPFWRWIRPKSKFDWPRKTAAQGLSVRQVEALVQEATSDQAKRGGSAKREGSQDPNVAAAVGRWNGPSERVYGSSNLSDQRGKIEIEYYSQAELDRLFQHIVGTAARQNKTDWCRRQDSNLRPTDYETVALTT